MQLDPASLSFIQGYFLERLSTHFHLIIAYATNLLYFFLIFEIIFAGICFAVQQSAVWERLLFQVIKLGFVFFIITNFPYIITLIINSFAFVGVKAVHVDNLGDIMLNPAGLWQYGFNSGVKLLKVATEVGGIGLPIIDATLGIGILLVFGLFAIQIMIQVLGFYVIALTGVFLMPFGVFTPCADMFAQVVQSLLKAGVRVMVMMIIVGIAIGCWNIFNVTNTDLSASVVLALGLFFSTLAFLCLSVALPKMAAEAVGKISWQPRYTDSRPAVASSPVSTSVQTAASGGSRDVGMPAAATFAAATSLSPGAASSTSVTATSTQAGGAVSSITTAAAPSVASSEVQGRLMNRLSQFESQMSQSGSDRKVSDKELQHIKQALLEALKEHQTDDKTDATDDEDDQTGDEF